MLSGIVVAVYFFLALSPLGPGGWWPILFWHTKWTGEGFIGEGNDPFTVIALITLGLTILLMIVFGLTGSVSSRHTRYEVFGAKG